MNTFELFRQAKLNFIEIEIKILNTHIYNIFIFTELNHSTLNLIEICYHKLTDERTG